MAVQQESVVTPERYQQGISWQQWMAVIDRNQEKFQENYDLQVIDLEDAAAIKALARLPNGPKKCLALGEAWCPDVFRGMPTMAKLSEATGIELKICFRDQNMDIQNEFLYKGEFASIPVLVFYTEDHRYLGHWIEKAKKVREEAHLMQAITSKMRNPDISEEERAEYMKQYAEFQRGPIWGGWRHAQVKEIREMLENACK